MIELGIANLYHVSKFDSEEKDKSVLLDKKAPDIKINADIQLKGLTKEINDKLGTVNAYISSNYDSIYELKIVSKIDLNTRQDKWWLDDVLNIYSRKANIRQLRRETFVRCPEKIMEYHKIVDGAEPDWYPWIPGSSFMTDGFQIKLPLISIRNNRTPGLDCLFEKGFSGFKAKHSDADNIDISTCKKWYLRSK